MAAELQDDPCLYIVNTQGNMVATIVHSLALIAFELDGG